MIEMRVNGGKTEWDEAVLDNGGHPFQLWGWGQLKTVHGWTAERYLAYENDEIVGGVQVLIKRLPFPFKSFAYAPRGPFGSFPDVDNFLEQVAAAVKSKYKSVVFSVEPDSQDFVAPSGWSKSSNKILPPETILLDISETESSLLAVMAKKTRQYIRKSSADVSIRQARSSEDIRACLDLYKTTAKRAGFALHSDQYYLDVFTQLGDHSPVFIAYSGDTPVAFLWLAISAEVAYELYGGVDGEGQKLRANYALKWHAVKKCKEWGILKYDFGGLIAGGVANFKQGWAIEETVLSGTFDRPLSRFYVLWGKSLPLAKRIIQKLRR